MAKAEEFIDAQFVDGQILAPSCNISRDLYDKNRFGEPNGKDRFVYAFVEALLLVEKGKMKIKKIRTELTFEKFIKLAQKKEPSFWTKYCVYKDLRKRGYIVKTALKFGADFRVYDRGVKPGEDHAKWVVFPVPESQTLTWNGFTAKNRVAHSTRKRLLLGIVDSESDVVYYETRWIRP